MISRAGLLALCVLLAGCVPVQQVEPVAVSDALEAHLISDHPSRIGYGTTHFYFEDWSGPRIGVWVYVPQGVNPGTAPIMFMLHGAKRGAARYLSDWDQIADRHGFIVIAPEFDRRQFAGSNRYNNGHVFADDGERNPTSEWTFSAIEPLFDTLLAALGSEQDGYTLFGHSAGSQFVHRFLYFMATARVKRVIAANAGWYTMPELDVAYPYGLADSGLTVTDLRRVLSTDVVVLLGDQEQTRTMKA